MAAGYSPAMTSVRGAVAVILILAAVAAATPFAPGTRFGTVGLDYRFSGGPLFSRQLDSLVLPIEPSLRAGIAVLPDLSFGAELALFGTFPNHEDMFTSTPVFAFGPTATYYLMPNLDVVRPYATAGAGATYAFVASIVGWRARLGAGAMVLTGLPVAFGLEAGWYGDWDRTLRWDNSGLRWVWLRGDTGFIGIRVMGFKQ
jgi:hypothetical protein